MQHALVQESPLFIGTRLRVLIVSQRPAAHHGEDEVGGVQVSTIGKHQCDGPRQILSLIEVELVPFAQVSRSEHDLKVITVDRLEIRRLEEEERFEVGLHVEEPSWQTCID